MLTQASITQMLHKEMPHLVAEYGIRRIGLFGSYAKGTPTESSDIDLVIEFERPIGFKFVELSDYLEHLLGSNVDILTPAGIENSRIAHIAQDIQASIVYV